MGELNTTLPQILEHKTVVESSQEKYEEKVNRLAEEGYMPSSQFGVTSCLNASNDVHTNYFMQMSRMRPNPNYVEPKPKNETCLECDKEIKQEERQANLGYCDDCIEKAKIESSAD